MKKRLIALAGGAAVLVAAAIPASSAFGSLTQCQQIDKAENLALSHAPSVDAFSARLSQFNGAFTAAKC